MNLFITAFFIEYFRNKDIASIFRMHEQGITMPIKWHYSKISYVLQVIKINESYKHWAGSMKYFK